MSSRGVKVVVVAATAAVLTGVLGATAWAETVTPGVEQPIFDLKAPGGLLGGTSVPGTPANGEKSSAVGRDGNTDGTQGGGSYYDSGSPFDDAADNGYWRKDGSGEDAGEDADASGGSSDDE